MKKKIRFIINPISGIGQKGDLPDLIEEHLNHDLFDYDIALTEYRKHAKKISYQSSLEGIDIVCAVGGDGSVHEVGTALIGTQTTLAIIPTGSGNGLARHLAIPLSIKDAIENINQLNIQKIDTIVANDKPFLNAAGFGFDAIVAKKFDESGVRGFKSYIKLALKEFMKFDSAAFKIDIDGQIIEDKAFMLSIANATEFGNGFCISPDSNLNDGLGEVVIVRPISVVHTPKLILQFFKGKIKESKHTEIITFKKLRLSLEDQIAHFDGEPFLVRKELNIEVIPNSLNILIGNN